WLTNRIMPHVLRTGAVPKGLFEIQDVHGETNALAAERWTAADDWLAYIEAMDRIGVSKELNRSWLENLARVHGVTVHGIWVLDFSSHGSHHPPGTNERARGMAGDSGSGCRTSGADVANQHGSREWTRAAAHSGT